MRIVRGTMADLSGTWVIVVLFYHLAGFVGLGD